MNQICLKCGQVHAFAQALPGNACPACGAVYAKVELAMEAARQTQASLPPLGSAEQHGGLSANQRYTLLWVLAGSCVAFAAATAVVAALYLQERHFNQVLISQRQVQPAVQVAKVPPAVTATAVPAYSLGKTQVDEGRKPPRNLADGAEVMVVSGYEAANQASNGTVVRVVIDRPGKAVVLVLASYDKIAWHIEASAGTQIKGIVVSSHERPRVQAAADIPVFQSKLSYSYDTNSGNFASMISGLNTLFGVQRIDVFRGKYALPNLITINQLDPPQSALTVQGEPVQKPLKALKFELTSSDYSKTPWTLEGPVSTVPTTLAASRSLKAERDQRIYQIVSHDFMVTDPASGQRTRLEMPDNFPSISWPVDVAYDSKRHLVTLATFGGEGFLYRFDTNTGKWLDFRSLNNADISALAYDAVADRYVAWTGYGLLFLSGDGTPLYTKPLADRLSGFKRLYDVGNAQPPSLIVVPKGDQIALVKPQGLSVGMIWYYDMALDVVQLTYKQPTSNASASAW